MTKGSLRSKEGTPGFRRGIREGFLEEVMLN